MAENRLKNGVDALRVGYYVDSGLRFAGKVQTQPPCRTVAFDVDA